MADLAARIEQLREMVLHAKNMPLSSSVMLNREDVLEILQAMADALPEEIRQAKIVVNDREELLARARDRAERLLAEAGEEQERILDQEAIVNAARERARGLGDAARQEALRIRQEADEYVDERLEHLETVLQRLAERMDASRSTLDETLAEAQRGRAYLRSEES